MVHRTSPRSGSPISDLEFNTRSLVDRAFAPARRAAERVAVGGRAIARLNNDVARRLRQANAPVIEAVTNATRQAVGMGVDDATDEVPPDQPVRFNDAVAGTLTADLTQATAADVRQVTRAAGAVAARATEDVGLDLVNEANTSANRLVVTRLIGAYNRGRRWYARQLTLDLEWVTVEDQRVCPVCRPLDGAVIASTRGFRIEGADFTDVPGQPPAHPRCRCFTKVVRPG